MTVPTQALETAVIRAARASEYAAVGELTYRGFGHHLPEAPQPDDERLNLLLDAGARAAAGDLLVAEDVATGELLGTVTVLSYGSTLARQAEPGEAEVRLLAVLPDARRRGLGWLLLDRATEIAVAQGSQRIVLDTGVDNHGSQNLYERYGYVRRPDREKPRPAPKVQLAVFTLDLATLAPAAR